MGRHFKYRINDAQALLLHYLWRKHGGPVNVARLCGVGLQHPNNWRMRGRVPLIKCRRVAESLDESIWALNYAELCKLFPRKECPKWNDVVISCAFDRATRDEIIFMEPPVVHF